MTCTNYNNIILLKHKIILQAKIPLPLLKKILVLLLFHVEQY
jgi:hypothetical protein